MVCSGVGNVADLVPFSWSDFQHDFQQHDNYHRNRRSHKLMYCSATIVLTLALTRLTAAPNITNRALVDPDTPSSAYTKVGIDDAELELVFSDEFNVEGGSSLLLLAVISTDRKLLRVPGRTFYVNEDP